MIEPYFSCINTQSTIMTMIKLWYYKLITERIYLKYVILIWLYINVYKLLMPKLCLPICLIWHIIISINDYLHWLKTVSVMWFQLAEQGHGLIRFELLLFLLFPFFLWIARMHWLIVATALTNKMIVIYLACYLSLGGTHLLTF